ncbi:GGDEF domain-containing protein [Sulfitobacter alexandrii]|uniref:GGDEF domain-containing protein n=1 Tax=Sulfitobacter alexandrii TaxID=1917485 RepID=A0A1J0WF71_9RHOB|nr:GGDEF domain-containing protein [Sulfitobacter alexandrii]APE42965.1 GGDEF domain-containing protein [Sulfitobacter alexandrii]
MTVAFGASALDVLCPMHLVIGAAGRILHAGPTACKLGRDRRLEGQEFLDVFAVNRPRAIACFDDLRRLRDTRLHLEMRAPPHTALKAVLVPAGDAEERLIVNLSFGISIAEGVRDFALSNADFAATDLAIEMLYLMEAKTAAMEESRRLNHRLQGARIAAEQQAVTDTLTGLANRRALTGVLARLAAGRVPFALMQIDLDFFKAVNDTLGHAAGDHVLRQVARIMREETRDCDTVARVGGDEFTVVLPDVHSADTLRRTGARIIERVAEPIPFDGHQCRVSASIGTVWAREGHAGGMDLLMADADLALYASKRAGRARHTFFDPAMRAPGPDRRRRDRRDPQTA